jgi:ABC-type multidrug transport system fused ATPase/permease subunit
MGIVISHRFSTVYTVFGTGRPPDPVLARRRVIEEGTHEELMAQAGRYRRLLDLQAAGYR